MDIRLVNLTKIFADKQAEVRAVDDLDVHIPSGKLIGLLGPSGCGKSTTLYMIAGLLQPTEGQIFFGDDDVTNLPPEERGIGLVFQNYALYPHMTVRQNIMFPLENLNVPKKEALERAQKMANLVGIGDLMNRKPKQLSGGQQQRVAIARALALNPDILCFDEPTSALDPELTGEVLRVIRELADRKTTMIIVTHEMSFAKQISDTVLFMDDGFVVECGSPEQVIGNPKEERTKQFLERYFENDNC